MGETIFLYSNDVLFLKRCNIQLFQTTMKIINRQMLQVYIYINVFTFLLSPPGLMKATPFQVTFSVLRPGPFLGAHGLHSKDVQQLLPQLFPAAAAVRPGGPGVGPAQRGVELAIWGSNFEKKRVKP